MATDWDTAPFRPEPEPTREEQLEYYLRLVVNGESLCPGCWVWPHAPGCKVQDLIGRPPTAAEGLENLRRLAAGEITL